MPPFSSINIELTKRCNLYCLYCYANANSKLYSDIDPERLAAFFKSFKNSGGQKVLLTGGEIFLHEYALDIIENAHKIGLIVDIFTNGTLIEDEQADVIKKYVNQVFISLDGPKSTHDYLSCVDGSYVKTCRAIERLGTDGVSVNLQTMIIPDNKDNCAWLLDVLHKMEIKTVVLSHVSQVGKGKAASNLILDDKQILSLLVLSASLAERCQYKTRVVTNVITSQMRKVFYNDFTHMIVPWMMPDGNIFLCYNTDYNYWKGTDYMYYPSFCKNIDESYKELNVRLLETTKDMEFFDLFHVIDEVSDAIIKENLRI